MHTVGGIATPAQALLEVVPLDSRLEIEAMVQNRDIALSAPVSPPRSRSTRSILPDTGCCTAPC